MKPACLPACLPASQPACLHVPSLPNLAGELVLDKARESHRKLRNSCRFMLGNLQCFRSVDGRDDVVELHELRASDRYMLHVLHR